MMKDPRKYDLPVCLCGNATLWMYMGDVFCCSVCAEEFRKERPVVTFTHEEYLQKKKSDLSRQGEIHKIMTNIHRLKTRSQELKEQRKELETKLEIIGKAIKELQEELKILK